MKTLSDRSEMNLESENVSIQIYVKGNETGKNSMQDINIVKLLRRSLLFISLLVIHYLFIFLPVLEFFLLYLIIVKPIWFEDF
jgi:hypothetical protein